MYRRPFSMEIWKIKANLNLNDIRYHTLKKLQKPLDFIIGELEFNAKLRNSL